MTKLAIIDLDGIVANVDARFAKAEEVKQEYNYEKDAVPAYWRTVFNPENVSLDTLIDGALEALNDVEVQGYKILFLTSRPETMRDATQEWLYFHRAASYHKNLANERQLVMKPPAFQFTKTVVWKAGIIQMLVALYGADDVLVVDDEPANLAELAKYDTSHMRLCASLAEAIAPEPDTSDHPF